MKRRRAKGRSVRGGGKVEDAAEGGKGVAGKARHERGGRGVMEARRERRERMKEGMRASSDAVA